jgi:hypothetical protein
MTNVNLRKNLEAARAIIDKEVNGQLNMWGDSSERSDSTEGQLFFAGLAQLMALETKQAAGHWPAMVPAIYPEGWSGFRDYGSDIANLAVGIAFLTNEMARKIGLGEDTYRRPRDSSDTPYADPQPAAFE